MIRNLLKAVGIFCRTLWRVARQLFHEVTGAAFAMFSFCGVMAAWRSHQARQQGWILALPLAYAVMMAIFAMSAYRSSRRVQ